MTTVAPKAELGVASEVGTLRTVIVHRPDVAHERLTQLPRASLPARSSGAGGAAAIA